jgi:hypothetical protein
VRERRGAPRTAFRGGLLPPAARIRPGHDVIVVDLSATGMLVEGWCRLRPASLVEVHLRFTEARFTVEGEIVRCFVSAIEAGTGVRYRAAVIFALALSLPLPRDLLTGYEMPTESGPKTSVSGTSYPRTADGPCAVGDAIHPPSDSRRVRVALDLGKGSIAHGSYEAS